MARRARARFRVAAARSLIGVATAVAIGCSNLGAVGESAVAPADERLESTHGPFERRVLLTGELQAVRSTRIIVPRIPGWQVPIRWIEQDGARVEAGQPVIELDNSQFAGELEQQRLAVDSAVNALMQKESDLAISLADQAFRLEQARTALEKARIRAAIPESIVSQRDHQEAQLELARAESAFRKAEDELQADREAAEAELDQLRIALRRAREEVRIAEDAIQALTLRAPADGILVIERDWREGRKLQVGDSVSVGQPVAEIPDLGEWKVEARLSDVDDGKVAPGMRAICTLDTFPELPFPGTLTEIGPVATADSRDAMRRGFDVEIFLDGADEQRMRPGMSVRAEVVATALESATRVPRRALRIGPEGAQVSTDDGGWVEVELGPCNPRECVVVSGLEPGRRLRAIR